MRIPKVINATLLSLLVALSMTAAAPVVALGADDATPATTASNASAGTATVTENHASGRRVQVATTVKTETENETNDTADDSQSSLHQKGASMLAELQKAHKSTKTTAQLEKRCVAHKQGLTKKFAAITTNSQRAQDRISDILTKVAAYQQTNNVQTANYTSLLTAAQTAQTTSAASIAALKAVTPTLDCNSTSTASDVATFKVAAQQVRTDLKAYRTAVKAVVADLRAAKTTTAEGSN